MHKVNSLRQRRIEKGLPKSEQTYRGATKNFAVAEIVNEEPVVEKVVESGEVKAKPAPEPKKSTSKKKQTKKKEK